VAPITIRKAFLIDSLGAVVSAVMHGVVLVKYEAAIGMPANVLYVLALLAMLFSIYSLLGYLHKLGKGGIYLKAIAIANLLYGCLTLGFLVYFRESITLLGLVYFLTEILVIVVLSIFELRIAGRA
jgi:hypothetical protein